MKLQTVYRDKNVILKVRKHPPIWSLWVRPAANLLPVTADGKILLMHEYKNHQKMWIWGFPGGMIEPGETASQAANRESQEELGLKASRLKKIVVVRTDFPKTSVTYFLRFGLEKAKKKNWEKISKVQKVTLARLVQLARKGTIRDPRMVVAILRLEDLVKRGKTRLTQK